MTSVRITPITRSVKDTVLDHRPHLRLTLKSNAPATGAVDGGWWPRSRDLATELPALLAALAERLGAVEGVNYNLDDWGPTARKITIDGSRVRLAGFRFQHRDTIDVYSRQQRLTLLVVAPEAGEPVAHAALRAAGQRANNDTVEAMLLPARPNPGDDGAEQRREPAAGPRTPHE
jgi:hypothetical protein